MKIRTKRRICALIMLVSLAIVLGLCGSVEIGRIGFHDAIGAVLVCLCVSLTAAWKGGYLVQDHHSW